MTLTRSLAVHRLLISCAGVALTATLWAADDRPAAPPATTVSPPTPADPPAVPSITTADANGEPLTHQLLFDLIGEQRYHEARRRLDEAIAASPEKRSWGFMYATLAGAIGDDPSDAALALLHQIVDSALAQPELDAATALGASTAAIRLVTRDQQLSADEKRDRLERLEQKIPGSPPHLAAVKRTLQLHRITLLIAADRKPQARAVLDALVDNQRAKTDPADSRSVLQFVDAVTTYRLIGSKHFPERIGRLIEDAEALTAAALAEDEIDMTTVIAYFSIRQARASALLRTNPVAAAAIADNLEEALESARERLGAASYPALNTYTRTLGSLRAQIDASLKIAALIGTRAPEINAESFVAVAPLTMQDLRGKVVLIDFWAVWCGPCVQRFPHLIRWHEKYADRGLVILGATRYYGYRWDADTNRAVRGEDIGPEEELAMLRKFRDSHQLRHGFFVTTKDSDYPAALSVTRLPHAVLIDQEGKIQMIRIGPGDAHAQDLEERIAQLLLGDV